MTRTLKSVDARTAARLKDEGALMVDVRESGEYASLRIPGSANVALSRLELIELPLGREQSVVFFCASGGRTNVHAARLAAKAAAAVEAYVLEGGIGAWGRAGLPVESGEDEDGPAPGFLARVFSR